MVAHQAVGMDYRIISGYGRFEIPQELLPVILALEYVFAFVPPGGDMVVSSVVFDSQWTAHKSPPLPCSGSEEILRR